MNVEELSFEEYLEKKGEFGPREPDDYPGITVGPSKWNTSYINKRGVGFMDLYHRDQLAAAPNPDNPDFNEFFLCKTTDGEGWSVNTKGIAGGHIARNFVAKLGDEFDIELKYEIEETDMVHPQWETPIFLATPRTGNSGEVLASSQASY